MNVSRKISSTLVFLALGVAAFGGDLPSAWRAWRYSREVENTPAASARSLAEIALPWDVLSRCRRACADLRVIDEQGREVPYEFNAPNASGDVRNVTADIRENSFVAGKFTQVIADFGDAKTPFAGIRVVTPQQDFLVRVELAVSDDAREWRVVEFGAPIGRVGSRSIEGTQDIAFQSVPARYVRLRILQRDKIFPVTSILGRVVQHPAPELAEIPASVHAVDAADKTDSGWQADMPGPNLPVSEIDFSTTQPEFYRIVRVSTSTDGKVWMERCSGIIYRYTHAGTPRAELTVPCSNGSDRFLRAEVVNNNDAPLSNLSLTLRGVRPSVVFYREPDRSYRVVYGNERAAEPAYDLAQTLGSDSQAARTALTLGPEQYTANFEDPRPFSERHPSLLWIALGIAVFALGMTAIKTMKSAAKTGS